MKRLNLLDDIYYSKEYVSLYLKDNESVFLFQYNEGEEIFYNIAIKRPVDKIGSVNIVDGYYDLETAYGYGGYYATTDDAAFLRRSYDAYQNKCLDERIIAEFIRFHPYNDIPVKWDSYFDFLALDRKTISIDLSVKKEERWADYSATTRNILRRSSDDLFINESVDIYAFMELYQSTMKRNNAEFSYYFDKKYYEELLLLDNVKLFAVMHNNCIVNMSFVLFGKQIMHYHLSANNNDFMRKQGNYYLLDFLCDYAKTKYPEISAFHLGGGRTNSTDDSLLGFKSKFSKIRNNFYIAGKVFNKSVYRSYIELFHELYPEHVCTKYFLKYRLASS